MDAEERIAIEGSIAKWEGILSGRISIYLVLKWCDLCHWSFNNAVNECKCRNVCRLGAVEVCYDENSTWYSIKMDLDEMGAMSFSLDDYPALKAKCEKMLAMLKGLLPDGE